MGLGIQCHHHFGSRILVGTLNHLGFCCSCAEVQKYEYSATVKDNTHIPGYTPGRFVQLIADNVDHNIRIKDSQDTFHGMGILASVTPSLQVARSIPRMKTTAEQVRIAEKINIHFYDSKQTVDLRYSPLSLNFLEDETYSIGILWKTTWLLGLKKSS